MKQRTDVPERDSSLGFRRLAIPVALFLGCCLVLAAGLAAAALRLERQRSEKTLRHLGAVSRAVETRLELVEDRVASTAAAVGSLKSDCARTAGHVERIASVISRLLCASDVQALELDSDPEEAPHTEPEDDPATAEDEELPPLPEGVPVERSVLQADLRALLADARLNPAGVDLEREDRRRLAAKLACARARVELLRAEIQLAVDDAARALEGEGRFIDYAKGEHYAVEEGVLTLGKELPQGGVRMFHFYPEEHPGIYAKTAEKRREAERFLRRLVRDLAGIKATKG